MRHGRNPEHADGEEMEGVCLHLSLGVADTGYTSPLHILIVNAAGMIS